MEPPRAQDKRRASTHARAHVAPELRTIEGYYLQAATKRARMVYVWGMVQGILAIAALIGVVSAYLAATSRLEPSRRGRSAAGRHARRRSGRGRCIQRAAAHG